MYKNKKTTINAINIKDNKCFQYDVPITLHYEKTEKHDERMSKIKPFINNHKQKEIKCSKHNDDWKTFDKNNVAIVLKVSYAKKEQIYPA